jgi:exosortase
MILRAGEVRRIIEFMHIALQKKDPTSNSLRLTQFSLILVSLLTLYSQHLLRLFRIWMTNEDYSHGLLIIPISIYLAWLKRHELSANDIYPQNWGFSLITIGLVCLLVGTKADISTLCSISFILVLGGLILYFFGTDLLKKLLFPLLFLCFMIPIPDQIYVSWTMPLQLLVTKVSVSSLSVLGIPLSSDGNVINLPEATLFVASACSGLRSVSALLALGTLFASTMGHWCHRIITIIGIIPIAVGINIARVCVSTLISYCCGVSYVEGPAHQVLGLMAFGLSVLSLYFLKSLLCRLIPE